MQRQLVIRVNFFFLGSKFHEFAHTNGYTHQNALKVTRNGRPVNMQLKIDKQTQKTKLDKLTIDKTSPDQDHEIVDKGQTLSNGTRDESKTTEGDIFLQPINLKKICVIRRTLIQCVLI